MADFCKYGFWRSILPGILRGVSAAILTGFLLSACATTTPPKPQYPTGQYPDSGDTPIIIEPTPDTPIADLPTDELTSDEAQPYLTPEFMDKDTIKRIAILLPFSAKSSALRQEASAMLQAAELSIFALDDANILLMAEDSKGTSQGASAATKSAIAKGADIILGPILAGSVAAAGQVAQASNIPVIGFSTDTAVAGNGVYLLSFPPEAEVARITKFASEAGAEKFAFLGPQSVYGRRVLNAYAQEVQKQNGLMVGVETYAGNDITVMQEPAARLANMFPSPEETAENPEFEDPYHVVLLPEGGTALRSLAPLLTFYNENTRHVQILGTGLWNRADAAQEPALAGGIFAGPDLDGKLIFNANFDATYGEEPTRLASLAYDGVSIAAFIAGVDKPYRHDTLIDPAGFFGVDGLVRFAAGGTPERGLAVYQIKAGRFVVIDPAPRSTDGAF